MCLYLSVRGISIGQRYMWHGYLYRRLHRKVATPGLTTGVGGRGMCFCRMAPFWTAAFVF